MIAWLIIVLALAGLTISLYFTFAYYGRVKKLRWIPEILCAREGSSCVSVVQTPYARVFGVPNSLLGILYYLGLLLWLSLQVEGMWSLPFGLSILTLPHLLVVASAVSVLLGFYLVYALRVKLRIDCPLCYAAHAMNAALLVLLLLLAR
jgi:uncharacterized membrane protein